MKAVLALLTAVLMAAGGLATIASVHAEGEPGSGSSTPPPSGSSGNSTSPPPPPSGNSTDRDGDKVPDGRDNCPDRPNPGQMDSDKDGIGDLCDADVDGDGVDNQHDNCPTVPNHDQADSNADGRGDACPSTTTSPCQQASAAEREACKQKFCHDHPNSCPPPPPAAVCSQHEAADRDACVKAYCQEHPASCPPCKAADGRPCIELGRFGHIQYVVATNGVGVDNVTVNDILVLVHLRLLGEGQLTKTVDGGVVKFTRGDDRIEIHDEPTGLLHYEGPSGLVLTFPASATIEMGKDKAVIQLDAHHKAILNFQAATRVGQQLTITGFAALHADMPLAAGNPEFAAKVNKALDERQFGAAVEVRGKDSARGHVEVLAYDDMNVTVDEGSGAPTADDPLHILVRSELHEGRTISVTLNASYLPSNGGRLELHYYDRHDDGTRTEVIIRQADGLDDVLKANDDAGQPEYWIVSDLDGTQHVLISIPHFSEHEITIAGLGVALTPSVAIGIGVGIVATVLASIMLFRPRRRADF
ncbi:MAG: thrombospondin type 3 repeat-containing protein [bacterium]